VTASRPSNVLAVRALHGAIFIGLVMITAVFAFLVYRADTPMLVSQPLLGLGLAVAGLGVLAVAVVILRPRLPKRGNDQSPEDYWDMGMRRRVLMVWVTVELAGLSAAMGYLLSGEQAALVVAVLAISTMGWFRPGRLEG
jgi:hypothetical protein